jgi:hypothetical protein
MSIIDKSDFPPVGPEYFVAEFLPHTLQDAMLDYEMKTVGVSPKFRALFIQIKEDRMNARSIEQYIKMLGVEIDESS